MILKLNREDAVRTILGAEKRKKRSRREMPIVGGNQSFREWKAYNGEAPAPVVCTFIYFVRLSSLVKWVFEALRKSVQQRR